MREAGSTDAPLPRVDVGEEAGHGDRLGLRHFQAVGDGARAGAGRGRGPRLARRRGAGRGLVARTETRRGRFAAGGRRGVATIPALRRPA